MSDSIPEKLTTFIVYKSMKTLDDREMGMPVASRVSKEEADELAAFLNYLMDQATYFEYLLSNVDKQKGRGGVKELRALDTNKNLETFYNIKEENGVQCLYKVQALEIDDEDEIRKAVSNTKK